MADSDKEDIRPLQTVERDFWEKVFVSAIGSGRTADEAADIADAAVKARRARAAPR
jgi:hypothetical protein